MKLIKKKKPLGSPMTQAKAKSSAALSLFSNAMKELNESNEILERQKRNNDATIERLLEENDNAEKYIKSNGQAMERLQDFVPLTDHE